MDKVSPTHPMPDYNDAEPTNPVHENPWERLKDFTDARIGLGRSGISVPTKHLLAFQLAHARAQDAVHTPLETESLISKLTACRWCPAEKPIRLHSKADDRAMYLQRPDFGRLLDEASRTRLIEHAQQQDDDYDLAIVVVDGLSAFAIEENILPFLDELIPALTQPTNQEAPWKLAPICVVEQGRVAIGDPVGELLNAKCVLVLVGERPGLSSPDSLGLYLTWSPRSGLTDAYRNCISNIRRAGLNYPEASRKAMYLLNEARTRKLSGVNLKDRTDESVIEHHNTNNNFLISKN